METNLKAAPAWLVPDDPGVPRVAALGSPTSHSLRRADRPSPAERAVPGAAIREYRIPNLARACHVLRLFAASDEYLSSSAVARRLKMPRTTVLRILHTLAAERLLQRHGFDFAASPELRTGLRSMADTAVRAAAVPVMKDLSQVTGETAYLALLAGDKVVVVETYESPHGPRVGNGTRAPMDLHGSAFGKVFLAFGPRACLERVLGSAPLQARTRRTLTTAEALATECGRIVKQGYALDDEEYEEGVRTLAAPVWASGGVLAAVIGVSASAATFAEQRVSDIAVLVLQAAKKLAGTLAEQTSR
ncbi:MAG TPA: IclR family transcriptional regulator [Polyangia bacterium]|nr:IclR family transcriptional regulator [Polyangia bacterium]